MILVATAMCLLSGDALLFAPSALAQVEAPPIVSRRLSAPQANLRTGFVPGSARTQQVMAGRRPAIMLTGYWPPSNEGVRPFSDDPVQNPQGWIGSDWEGRGYDVYAYFAEYSPPTCTSCGSGAGDLEVDYQDTSNDFWLLADALQPIAIITFSRTNAQLSWEVEMNQYNRTSWTNDYTPPLQPTPSPPDAGIAPDALRLTALPAQQIVDDIMSANLGLDPFICFSQSAGGFVSGFIAYHGVWYQALHDQPSAPDWCVAAGHVHVGRGIAWSVARDAVEVTLRTVIQYVDSVVLPGTPNLEPFCFGDGGDGMGCTDCPCSNNAPAGSGGGCRNSNASSQGACLAASGAPDVSAPADTLRFEVTGANASTFGVLVSGSERLPSNPANPCVLQNPGSGVLSPAVLDGLRCVGAGALRHGSRASDTAGDIGVTNAGWGPPNQPLQGIGVTSGFVSGQTRHFQVFYRELATLSCMTGQNTTNGISVTFQ